MVGSQYRKAHDYLRLEAMHLAESDNTRDIECPFCPPEDKEKGSLSVSRTEEGLIFQCYRAKCGAHGFVPTSPVSRSAKENTVKKKKKGNSFDYVLSKLTDEQYRQLILNYNLTVDEIDSNGLRWAGKVQRLAIPLFDKHYLQWGWESKVIRGLEPPWHQKGNTIKSITYPTVEDKPRLYYPKLSKEYVEERSSMDEDTVVIVEDVISAIRIMRYRDSVALLGSSLNMMQVLELMEGYKNVVLALDEDATDKAIKIAREYSGYFQGTFEVKQLSKDPKNMSEDELEKEFLLV